MSELTLAARLRWILITVAVAAVAVPLSFLLWRAPSGAAAPPPDLLPYFVVIGVVIPALSFGFGISFLLLGRGYLHLEQDSRLARGAFLSIGWLLTNWWPHSNFHRVAGGWTNIVLVDYFFHTTVIVATGVVAIFYLKVLSERRAAGHLEAAAQGRASAPVL